MDNSLYTSGEWTSEPYRSDNDQQLIKTQDKTKLIAVVNEGLRILQKKKQSTIPC